MIIKRFLSYFSLVLLFLSCANISNDNANKDTITAKDYFNRDIKIPIKVNRIIPMYYVQAEMICVLGASDKIVGIGKLFAIQSKIIHEHFPLLYKLPQVGIQNNLNYEKVISLKPDIVFCGIEKEVLDRLEHFKISTLSTFPTKPTDISEQILLYGKILDKSDNALKIVNFLNKEYNYVINRLKCLNECDRPKVYYARTDLFTTLGSGINSKIIVQVGGINVTNNLPNDMNGIKVSLENIYNWNPDIIILRDRATITPEEIYKDDRLKGLNAVKNRKIYQETFGWTEFRIGMYFGMLEKAKWLHPNLFQDINPQKEYEHFVKLYQSFNL